MRQRKQNAAGQYGYHDADGKAGNGYAKCRAAGGGVFDIKGHHEKDACAHGQRIDDSRSDDGGVGDKGKGNAITWFDNIQLTGPIQVTPPK